MSPSSRLLRSASACALALASLPFAAHAQEELPTIDVAGQSAGGSSAPAEKKPFSGSYVPESVSHTTVVSSATREEIDKTVNTMTTAETFKYLPSVLVRERFIGDRNATVQGRVNNPQDSARTMVYADGVLLSNYLGNSYAYPPRWGMVSPAEIDRIDVIAGPMSALYGGNSLSGVYTVTTRMPDHFELHASATGALQPFNWYNTNTTNLSGNMNILVGDRINDLSFWFGYDRLDAQGQTQTFSLNPRTSAAGKNLIDGYGGVLAPDPSGTPYNLVAGGAGADHSQQHMGKFKIAYDLAPGVRAKYQIGFWSLVDDTFVDPYLTTKDGVPIYNLGKNTLIGGALGAYSISGLNPTHSNASHLMQSAELKSDTGGVFDYDLVATQYNYLRDYTNSATSYGLIPTAAADGTISYSTNPSGSNVNQGGNYWRTFDARAIYRPEVDILGRHVLSFGGNAWTYSLNSVQTNTLNWTSNFYTSIKALNYGKVDMKGVYLQDEWKFHPQWRLTLGARGDFWDAYDGANYNPGKASTQFQASQKGAFSPKGALEYQVTPEFLMRGSIARNYRFPTVTELFQGITTPNSQLINNPYLQPESSTYYEATGEYRWANAFNGAVGMIVPRVSLFMDDRWNFINSQTTLIGGFSTTAQSNIDKIRMRGVEGAINMTDVYVPGLNFNASATFVDAKILSDATMPYIQGNQVPRIPRIRMRAVASYSPTPDFSVAAGVRFATGAFTQLTNTDFSHDVYGNTDSSYLVFDAKANYKFAPNWTLTAGIDNIGRYKYLVNPNPYPQRTFFLGVKYDFGGPQQTASASGNGGYNAPAGGGGNAPTITR
jgi:iron complex outermembrane recepter protein